MRPQASDKTIDHHVRLALIGQASNQATKRASHTISWLLVLPTLSPNNVNPHSPRARETQSKVNFTSYHCVASYFERSAFLMNVTRKRRLFLDKALALDYGQKLLSAALFFSLFFLLTHLTKLSSSLFSN